MIGRTLSVLGLDDLGVLRPGDRIARLIAGAIELVDGDIVVVPARVLSTVEGRTARVRADDRDALHALVESEATRVLRRRRGLIIAETSHGFVCAAAGIDASGRTDGAVLLLPVDPDRSARRIRDELRAEGPTVGVVVSHRFGRAWRRGSTGVALGLAGVAAMSDDGSTCIADEIASAAELALSDQTAMAAVVLRGADPSWLRESSVQREVVRTVELDLFR